MSRMLQMGSWCLGFFACAMLALALLAFPAQRASADDDPPPATAQACAIFCQANYPNDLEACYAECIAGGGVASWCPYQPVTGCSSGWCVALWHVCKYHYESPTVEYCRCEVEF